MHWVLHKRGENADLCVILAETVAHICCSSGVVAGEGEKSAGTIQLKCAVIQFVKQKRVNGHQSGVVGENDPVYLPLTVYVGTGAIVLVVHSIEVNGCVASGLIVAVKIRVLGGKLLGAYPVCIRRYPCGKGIFVEFSQE